MRTKVALVSGMLLGACAGPVHVARVGEVEQLVPRSYGFAELSPNGSDIEVQTRQILAAKLATRGFVASTDPYYIIDIGVSERPGTISVYTGEHREVVGRDDVAPKRPFMGLCDDSAVRLTLAFTVRASGQQMRAIRSGKLRCTQGLSEMLPTLTDAALTGLLR